MQCNEGTYLHVPVKGVGEGRKGGVEGIVGVPGSIGVVGGLTVIGGLPP